MLRIESVGANNLPSRAREAMAELFGPIPELREEALRGDALPDFQLATAQAQKSGYANSFEALPRDVPWRPQLDGGDGRAHPRPTAMISAGFDGQGEGGAVPTPGGAGGKEENTSCVGSRIHGCQQTKDRGSDRKYCVPRSAASLSKCRLTGEGMKARRRAHRFT